MIIFHEYKIDFRIGLNKAYVKNLLILYHRSITTKIVPNVIPLLYEVH